MSDNENPRERMNEEDIIRKKDMIFEDILKLVVNELNVSPTEITADLNIIDDLMFDSMQIYELVIDLEEAYDIRLPDDLIDSAKTVGDVVDLVYTLSLKPKE